MAALDESQLASLARARLLALDVDGTLTAGRVQLVGDRELQEFCVQDGQGLVWLREAGLEIVWITGRGCETTRRRAEELKIRELVMRAGPKEQALKRLQEQLGIGVEQTVSMGDDLPDLALAARSAFFACPANARPEVRERAQLVTAASGGAGAVRELAEAILRARGDWEELLGRYAP